MVCDLPNKHDCRGDIEDIKLATLFDGATPKRLRKAATEFDESHPDSHRSDNKNYIAASLSLLYTVRANHLRHER